MAEKTALHFAEKDEFQVTVNLLTCLMPDSNLVPSAVMRDRYSTDI